jgi:hypothetical protein
VTPVSPVPPEIAPDARMTPSTSAVPLICTLPPLYTLPRTRSACVPVPPNFIL